MDLSGDVYIDIFSCKEFDCEKVINVINKIFRKKYSIYYIYRMSYFSQAEFDAWVSQSSHTDASLSMISPQQLDASFTDVSFIFHTLESHGLFTSLSAEQLAGLSIPHITKLFTITITQQITYMTPVMIILQVINYFILMRTKFKPSQLIPLLEVFLAIVIFPNINFNFCHLVNLLN